MVKPSQVFSRIHVDDIASGLAASIARPRAGGIYNLCDDEPAPPQDVIAYAAQLMGAPEPLEAPFDPNSRFYAENKRVSNALAKAELSQSAKQAGKGAGMFAGAGIAAHMVLLFISIALWWSIGNATGRGWSALIVAAIWAVIAAILAATGRKEIKSVPGVPQTADTVKKIPSAVAGNEETR